MFALYVLWHTQSEDNTEQQLLIICIAFLLEHPLFACLSVHWLYGCIYGIGCFLLLPITGASSDATADADAAATDVGDADAATDAAGDAAGDAADAMA